MRSSSASPWAASAARILSRLTAKPQSLAPSSRTFGVRLPRARCCAARVRARGLRGAPRGGAVGVRGGGGGGVRRPPRREGGGAGVGVVVVLVAAGCREPRGRTLVVRAGEGGRRGRAHVEPPGTW